MLVHIYKETVSRSGTGTEAFGWEVKDKHDHDVQGQLLFECSLWDEPECVTPSTTATFVAGAQRGQLLAGAASTAAKVLTDNEAKFYGQVTGTGTTYLIVSMTEAGPLVEQAEIIPIKLS